MVQKEPSRPRGRPRSFDAETALKQARDAFWRNGYAATSLDDLAAATGLNRPSLYGAFGDKRALYLAALEHTRAEMMATLHKALAVEGPLREVLARIYGASVKIYLSGEPDSRGCFLVGTAVTEAVAEPPVRTLLTEAFGEIDAAFEARFRKMPAELPSGVDPAAHAKLATAMLHTLAVRARGGAAEPELRTIAAAAVDMLCGPAK